MQLQPRLTLLTSQALQRDVIGSGDDEETMDTIKEHRDRLLDVMAEHEEFLDALEEAAGVRYTDPDLEAWICAGIDEPISSPALIPVNDAEKERFDLFFVLADTLIIQHLEVFEDLYDGNRRETAAASLATRVMDDLGVESDPDRAERYRTSELDWPEDQTLAAALGVGETEEPVDDG